MSRFSRHIPTGTRVKVYPSMGIRSGGAVYCYGEIKSRDGEYYIVNIEYNGPEKKLRLSGVDCERYLCEIEKAYIEGKWVNEA